MVKLTSLRVLFSIAAAWDLELHSMDFETAFLHSNVEEEIYMEQPPLFSGGKPGQVCRLLKSLYGLKQAPRNWYQMVSSWLLQYGFKRSSDDCCIFIHRGDNGSICIIGLYVDDLAIAFNDHDFASRLKSDLTEAFRIVDMGELSYILGITVTRDRPNKVIMLDQHKYLSDILRQYNLTDIKPEVLPMPTSFQTTLPSNGPDSQQLDKKRHELYRSMLGSLQYLQVATRPDISTAVGILARSLHAPQQVHLNALKRVYGYLKASPAKGIIFRGGAEDALVLKGGVRLRLCR